MNSRKKDCQPAWFFHFLDFNLLSGGKIRLSGLPAECYSFEHEMHWENRMRLFSVASANGRELHAFYSAGSGLIDLN